MGRRGRLLRRVLRSTSSRITIFWRGWRAGHVFSGSLTLFGRRRLFRGCSFALPRESPVAKFPENIQKEDSGDAQHDQTFEETIHRGDSTGDNDPADPRKRDEAEQNGNQEHHGKQWTSSSSFIARVSVVTR